MERRAVEMAQELERSQRGNGSLFALFALARQQQRLAGRKALVYFSEGLEVPNQLEPLYRSVVSEANRANLSIYSVDARGLLTTSGNEAARRDLLKSMETVRRQVQSRGGRAVTREDVLAGEVAENAITLNVQGMLGSLSESTGGRLIANSNDVRTGLDRALADLSGYYEVTYDPQLTAYDGASA
jgi:VWFA-related protein